MFGVVSKFVGYLLGSDEDASGTREELEDRKKPLKHPPQTKSLTGKVTKVYEDAGLVDDEIYFSLDCVVGQEKVRVGTDVHVEALREGQSTSWRATRVSVIRDWRFNDTGDTETTEIYIGTVTQAGSYELQINNEHTVQRDLVPPNFRPCVGDWVQMELVKVQDEVIEIRGFQALREKSLTGVVTQVGTGWGVVEQEVFFHVSLCGRGYRPRKGDQVKVTAVESEQRQYSWRATSLEPVKTIQTPRAVSQPFVGQFSSELHRNKEGILITETIDFGDVLLGNSKTLSVWIRNNSKEAHQLKACTVADSSSQISFHYENEQTAGRQKKMNKQTQQGPLIEPGQTILPGQTRQISTTLNARQLGHCKQLVLFDFGYFVIGRYLIGNVQDPRQMMLNPTSQYRRPVGRNDNSRYHQANDGWIVPGQKPLRKRMLPSRLKAYDIPNRIRECLFARQDLGIIVPALAEDLSLQNYEEKFSALLHAEEFQQELDMRQFDLEEATFVPVGEFLCLTVPGLAEGRPSLLMGDRVVVSLSDASEDDPKFEGYIHEVRQDSILLKFHEDFHNRFANQDCDVVFYFNRGPMRRAHQAAEFSPTILGEEVLFPREISAKLPSATLQMPSLENDPGEKSEKTDPRKDFFNKTLNERQCSAVCRILSGQCRPTPYLLFGPPGTGKTVTVVEAILQVFSKISSSRILACAPSNSAADLIAERLHASGELQVGEMVRLNAFQRGQEIPQSISQYCVDTDDLAVAAHHRIVICTCTTAGQLNTLGLRNGHFTHVFVDEAGQATEPECLVPLGVVAGGEGQIVLAGDPFQLGPVLRSQQAKDYGLDTSLLERLMTRPLYCRNESKFADHGCYDPLLVTKLVNNYRAHPVLLRLPSSVFYHDELVPCVDPAVGNSLVDFELLPNKDQCPLIFHGVRGEDLREGDSPSWFNAVEVMQVMKYVQALRSRKLSREQIGIITPYRKQVEKIRMLFSSLGMEDIKVGSVEEFQGQERIAIIVSTVRSCEAMVDFDVCHNIGFLSNPKRFNVTITRAQALLVVIGNPHVLAQDPHWYSLLRYCVKNKAYVGCDLPPLQCLYRNEDFLDITERAGLGESCTEWDRLSGVDHLKNTAVLLNQEDNTDEQAECVESNPPAKDGQDSSLSDKSSTVQSYVTQRNGIDKDIQQQLQSSLENELSNDENTEDRLFHKTSEGGKEAMNNVEQHLEKSLVISPKENQTDSNNFIENKSSDSDEDLEDILLVPQVR